MNWEEPEELEKQLAEAISKIPPKIKRRGRILWEGDIDEVSFKAGKQEGRREVVEWIEAHLREHRCTNMRGQKVHYDILYMGEWQVFKKSKGIDSAEGR